MKPNNEQDFWCKVNILGSSDCWEWTASKDRNGYGRFKWRNKSIYAHRFAYILSSPYDNIDGWDILHTCDNPGCCNALHLYKGTHLENMQDKYNHGKLGKLDWESVDCIRSVYENGDATQKQLAKYFGVCRPTINLIINNKTWKGVWNG
jgi:hypothetical protein